MADNPNNKRISALSLVGKDRYDQYLQELSAEGTIAGEQLTPSERKEAFKKRTNKVQFKTFVEKVLQKKAIATAKVKPIKINILPGTKDRGGALAKIVPQQEVKKPSLGILKVLNSIFETLKNRLKFDKKTEEDKRKDEEKEKRSKKEDALEGVKKVGKKIIDKVIEPFKGIFDRIWKFITFTLLGRAFTQLMNWLGDPKNAQKVQVLGRFLKDWWPALLGLYFMPFKGFIFKTLGQIAWFSARFAAQKLIFTPAGAFAGLAALANEVTGQRKAAAVQTESKAKAQTGKGLGVRGTDTMIDKSPSVGDLGPTTPYGLLQGVSSGGFINPNTGIKISGAGPDTQLTALQPGEIVMNRAAVKGIGAKKLLALNSMFGGSNANQPRFADNIQFAQGGGLIGRKPMGLRGADLMRIMHGTGEGIPELIRQSGFKGQTGMLGKGVYGSIKGWVADTYRGAGNWKGILPGQGPRLNMLVPQAARTFRGATVVSERQANRGLRIAEGILSGKYTGAKARSLMPLLMRETPTMAQAFGKGLMKLGGRAMGLLNAPVIGDMFDPQPAGGSLEEAYKKGYYKGPMPTPPSKGRSRIINLPPITQTGAAAGMAAGSGTQVPAFSAVSPSGSSDRAMNASIYGIV
jgi:hypothetical protein